MFYVNLAKLFDKDKHPEDSTTMKRSNKTEHPALINRV